MQRASRNAACKCCTLRVTEWPSHIRINWIGDVDPEALFREHVYVSPFWEDDLAQVAEFMGEDRVLFGSDWPHMEGLTKPGDVFPLIHVMTPSARAKFLCKNTTGLNVRNGV